MSHAILAGLKSVPQPAITSHAWASWPGFAAMLEGASRDDKAMVGFPWRHRHQGSLIWAHRLWCTPEMNNKCLWLRKVAFHNWGFSVDNQYDWTSLSIEQLHQRVDDSVYFWIVKTCQWCPTEQSDDITSTFGSLWEFAMDFAICNLQILQDLPQVKLPAQSAWLWPLPWRMPQTIRSQDLSPMPGACPDDLVPMRFVPQDIWSQGHLGTHKELFHTIPPKDQDEHALKNGLQWSIVLTDLNMFIIYGL